MKDRLMRESEAMLLYISGRGIAKELPKDGAMTLLDLPTEERHKASLDQILHLHQSLSRLVAPALPETIERLHAHQELLNAGGGLWRRMAPLGSVFFLLIFTIALAGVLALSIAFDFIHMSDVMIYLQGECRGLTDDAPPALEVLCQQQRAAAVLSLYVYFGFLGALGAAYSSIYDSFAYIREGRYDMRLASTYYVRIFLGAFSGILLAEPLATSLNQGAFSSSLLAFMGGFGAQLVYDLLNRIVDSIGNMFRPERSKERRVIHEQAAVNAREAILEDDANKRFELVSLLESAKTISDPTARAEALQQAILRLISGTPDGPVPTTSAAPGSAPLPPPGRAAVDLSALQAVLDPGELAPLARAIAVAGARFDHDARQRWQAVLSGQTTADPLAHLDGVDLDGVDLPGPGPIGAAIAKARNDPATEQRLQAYLLKGDGQELFALIGSDFEDRSEFDAALAHWAQEVLRAALTRDLRDQVLTVTRDDLGAARIIDILDATAQNPKAAQAIEALFAIAAPRAVGAGPSPDLNAVLRAADAISAR